jgi:formate dehydrogenase subunit gamma
MLRSIIATFAKFGATIGLAMAINGSALAQAAAPAVAPATAPDLVAPAPTPAASGGIQSANIMDIKPEASLDPGYAKQSNAERGKVQPGNNAPMWRQVGSGVEGFTSYPKSTAPESNPSRNTRARA